MSSEGRAVFARIAWRLIPFMGLLYVVNFLDRVNVGFAALTMNRDIGLDARAYGWGAGMFFVGYFFFEVPSNMMMERFGARLWMFRIMLTWGLVSCAMIFAQGPWSFYGLRFLLGVAEAGFFPGMMLYLTYWFPAAERAKFNALFFAAIPLANVVGGPLSGLILGLHGLRGLHGWQWLFLLEGLPAILLSLVTLLFLPDQPERARWLSQSEKALVRAELQRDAPPPRPLVSGLRDIRVLTLALADFGIIVALYGVGFWLPQIVSAMGYSNLETGFVVAIPYLLSTIAMILWARSSDARNERVWHLVIAVLLAASGIAAAAGIHDETASLIALSVAVVGIYCALVSFWTLPPSFLGGTAAAGGIALINSIANLGGFLGPVLLGWVKQATGNYAAGMAMLAGGLVMTAVIILGMVRIRALALTPAPR